MSRVRRPRRGRTGVLHVLRAGRGVRRRSALRREEARAASPRTSRRSASRACPERPVSCRPARDASCLPTRPLLFRVRHRPRGTGLRSLWSARLEFRNLESPAGLGWGAMDYKDYYKILGVAKTATDKEIKAAFRKLARKHHPDVNPGNKEAEARFKEINEANEVLGDKEKRKRYDELGANWNAFGREAPQGRPWPGGGDADRVRGPRRGGRLLGLLPDVLQRRGRRLRGVRGRRGGLQSGLRCRGRGGPDARGGVPGDDARGEPWAARGGGWR